MKYIPKIGISLLIIIFFCFCSKSQDDDIKKEERKIPIEVIQVIQGSISSNYSATSTIEAEREAEVIARVEGVLNKILVEEGDQVTVGKVLAELDDKSFQLEYNKSLANLNKLKNNFARNKKLQDENIISKENFDKVKYELKNQKAISDMAELNLKYTKIKAPIRGVISQRYVKEGNLINQNQKVFRITNLNQLRTILYIPEKEIRRIKEGLDVSLEADAVIGEVFKCKVEKVNPVVDSKSGTVKVIIKILPLQPGLKPGMFVRVNIICSTHHDVLLVPVDTLVIEDQETYLFVVKDGVAKSRDVKVGYSNSEFVEILSGLEINETVVSTGLNNLKDDTKIKIVK